MDEIRRIRRELGIKQTELAAASGVDRATLNQVEKGRRSPTIATLERLAVALGVEVADFFPKAEPPLFRDEPAQRGWVASAQAAGAGTGGEAPVPRLGGVRGVPRTTSITINEAEIRRYMEPVERGETTADEAAPALADAIRTMIRGGGHAPAT